MAQNRLDVHLFCRPCGHSVMIDARVLVDRHGATLAVQRFLERLQCSRCGAKCPDVDLHVSPRLPAFTGYPGWAAGSKDGA